MYATKTATMDVPRMMAKTCLGESNGIQTRHNHTDTPCDIHDQKHNGKRRCPLLHGQNEPSDHRVENTDNRA